MHQHRAVAGVREREVSWAYTRTVHSRCRDWELRLDGRGTDSQKPAVRATSAQERCSDPPRAGRAPTRVSREHRPQAMRVLEPNSAARKSMRRMLRAPAGPLHHPLHGPALKRMASSSSGPAPAASRSSATAMPRASGSLPRPSARSNCWPSRLATRAVSDNSPSLSTA